LVGRASRFGVASSCGRHCSALRGRTVRFVAFRAFHPVKPLSRSSILRISKPIPPKFNLNPVVGRGEVYGSWGAGQGAMTRNATAQGGAVPSAGRCDPEAGCGCLLACGTRSRHPLRCPIPAARSPSGDASGRHSIPRSCSAAMCPKNCAIPPVATSLGW
jgi:hypothetical protein